jgi:ribosome-associated heat shock protein Hsp15
LAVSGFLFSVSCFSFSTGPPPGGMEIARFLTAAMEIASPPVRIDRWLWAARLFRSRSLAAAACDGGKVDINGQPAKPHKLARAGDLVRVTLPAGKRQLRIIATAERRGPAGIARQLYSDLTPPAPPVARAEPPPWRYAGGGRPTKRDRRQLRRFRDL